MKKLVLFCTLVSVVSAELLIAIPTSAEVSQQKIEKVQNQYRPGAKLLIALPTAAARQSQAQKKSATVGTENRQSRKIIVRPPLQQLFQSQWDNQDSLQDYTLVPVEMDEMGRFSMQEQEPQYSDKTQQQQQQEQDSSASGTFSMPSFLPSQLQNMFGKQKQQAQVSDKQQDTSGSFSMPSFLPAPLQNMFGLQKQEPEQTSYKAEMNPNGGISITIKLEPHQLPGLSFQQSQYQQTQPQTANQNYQTQASQTQNTIIAAPTQSTTGMAALEYDSQSGFWKEVKTLLSGLPLPKLFATSETKPALSAQISQLQNNYVQPQQLASYFQNVGTANSGQSQKQKQQQNLQQQQQQGFRSQFQKQKPPVNIITQPKPVLIQLNQQQKAQLLQQKPTYKPQVLMAKPNPYPPNNYLLNNPDPTTAAPTSEQSESETPMLVNLASTIAKTVGEIPSNLDLLFNDMGRTYRRHLFQLRDAMPENPYAGYMGGFKRRPKKNQKQQQQQVIRDEFLDGYGV